MIDYVNAGQVVVAEVELEHGKGRITYTDDDKEDIKLLLTEFETVTEILVVVRMGKGS